MRIRRLGLTATLLALAAAAIGPSTASATWTLDNATEGFRMTVPAIAIDGADHQGVASQRAGRDPGIFFATDATGSWAEERVTSGPDWSPSLGFDGAGHAHIAYGHYGTASGVAYATNASGVWVTSTVHADADVEVVDLALDAADKAHIVYASYGTAPGIYYLTNATGTWVRTRLTSGAWDDWPSIAIGPTGTIHVAFQRRQPEARGTVYFKKTSGGAWAGTSIAVGNDDYQPMIAVGANDTPHIVAAHYDTNEQYSIYYSNDGGGWYAQYMQTDLTVEGIGAPAIAVAPDGKVHVLVSWYHYGSNGATAQLRHFIRPGAGAFDPSTAVDIDPAARADDYPSLAFTSGGGLRLAFQRQAPSQGIRVSSADCCSTVLSAGDDHYDPAIARTSDGHLHIGFERRATDGAELEYGTNDGTGWTTEKADDLSGPGGVDIAAASDGTVRIAGGDGYASGSAGAWTSDKTFTDGSHDAVAVDASDKTHVANVPYGFPGTPASADYYTNSTGPWTSAGVCGQDADQEPAIAVTPAGVAHVVCRAGQQLWHLVGPTFTTSDVIFGGTDAYWPDVAIDGSGHLWVAYWQGGSAPGIHVATNASGSWSSTWVTRSWADGIPSIAIAPNGKVVVAVARASWASNPGLYVATNRSGSWKTTLAVIDYSATDASVVVEGDGTMRIVYDGYDGIQDIDETGLTAASTVKLRVHLGGLGGRDAAASGVSASTLGPDAVGTASRASGPAGARAPGAKGWAAGG
jgi:hypothetical protein